MALDFRAPSCRPRGDLFSTECREKIGFVPNVLVAYAHDMAKLRGFVDFLQ